MNFILYNLYITQNNLIINFQNNNHYHFQEWSIQYLFDINICAIILFIKKLLFFVLQVFNTNLKILKIHESEHKS